MQNKGQFIETLATTLGEGTTKKYAGEVLEAVIEAIRVACKEDEGVKIVGVGEVVVKETKATSGNMNGKEWTKPAGKTIKAKVSKAFIAEIVGE